MTTEYAPIDISNVPDLLDIAEEVRRTKRPRLLRRANEDLAIISPVRTAAQSSLKKKSSADMDAFWSSFGSWKDVDTEALKADIYESRRLSTKPRPDL